MRITFDTNVPADAEGINGAGRRDAALNLIRRLPQQAAVVAVQVLGEFFDLLVRKGGRPCSDARDAPLNWRDAFPVVETSAGIMLAAADLATNHHLGIWDAVGLSAASKADCHLLLSEDLQDGFNWAGVTMINPFSSPRHGLLNALLGEDAGAPGMRYG